MSGLLRINSSTLFRASSGVLTATAPGMTDESWIRPATYRRGAVPGGALRLWSRKANSLSPPRLRRVVMSVAQVDPELRRVVHMSVRADQSGNDRLPLGIDLFRAGRNLDSFSDSFDSPISNQQSCVFNRRLARPSMIRAPTQACSGSCGGLVVLRRVGCQRGQGDRQNQDNAGKARVRRTHTHSH